MSYLLNPYRFAAPGGGGGITGVYTPQQVLFSSADTAGPFTGTVNGVVAGQRVCVFIPVLASAGGTAGDPALWTVTWDGSPITPADQVTATAIYIVGAVYDFVAPASGNITLSLTLGGASRAHGALVWLLDGVDAGAPHFAAPDVVKTETSVVTASLPATISVTDPGCLVLSAIAVKGGNITTLTATGDDAEAVVETGTTNFTDMELGWAYDHMPAAGDAAITWGWTTGGPWCGFHVIYRPAP